MRMARILATVLVAALLASRVPAQHLGDVSLSTTATNLATNLACTGAAQNFITGTTAGFSNTGQIRHLLSATTSGVQKFQAEIDGIDNQGNIYRISDVMELAGKQGTLIGNGNFPRIQVSITCSPGTGTFTASYAGDFGSSPVNAGIYLTSQIDHVNFFAAPANVGQQDNAFQTPFGSSAGTLYFQFNTTSVAGATVTVVCNTVGIAAATAPVLSVTPVSTTALQTFAVPASSCPLMSVQYASPGGGTTVTAEFVFSLPGMSTSNNGNATGALGSDPCQSPHLTKQSQPINIVTATTTSIVNLVATSSIYVCGGFMTVASSGTAAATVQFEYGTGATCGTGTTVLTGTMGTGTATAGIDSEPVILPGGMTNFSAPVGNRLCIVTAGTTVNVQGYITYVQQ